MKRYNEYITIRVDESLKESFEIFCAECGMSVSGAVSLLVRNAIKAQRIPFELTTPSALSVGGYHEGGDKQAVRFNVRVAKEEREAFKAICDDIGIKMSRLIKVFMTYCVKNDKCPF